MASQTKKTKSSAKLLEGDVLNVLKKTNKTKYDLIVTSPPYNIGKVYERSAKRSFEEYLIWLDKVIDLLVSSLTEKGSICWQVGSFVKNGEVFPLDIYTYEFFKKRGMKLRNRIVWRFNFGLHSTKRFSGRFETVLWFTKSDHYCFNLDAVRVPQLYPGKRHSKSKGVLRHGKPSGNPLGKNPSDFWEFSAETFFKDNPIWDIPNVKANHPEKTIHPCQFPIELAERCILALTNQGDTVLDPFMGTGTTAIAALKNDRNVVGIDTEAAFIEIARERIKKLKSGSLQMRASGKEVRGPRLGERVSKIPEEWVLSKRAGRKLHG